VGFEQREETQSSKPPDQPLLLRAKGAANLCGTSVASWWRWVAGGLCPSGIKVGGHRLWNREHLELWCRWGCPRRDDFEARLAAQANGRA
jgi:hypothetical protein